MQASLSPEVLPPGSIHSNESPNGLASMVADSNSPSDGDSPNAPSSGTSDSRNQAQPPIIAVPAACLACRGKHLKCDGQNPCSRCLSSQSECIYVASRRGYKGPRRNTAANPNKRQRSSSPSSSVAVGDNCPMLLGANGTSAAMPTSLTSINNGVFLPDTPGTAFEATPSLTNLQLYRSFGNAIGFNANQLALSQAQPQNGVPAQVPVPTLAERCLDSFYHHFHACHPFALPKEWLLRIMRDTNIEPLLAAVRWVGSLFLDVGPARAGFLDEALRLVQDPTTNRDGFFVQALILLIVCLDGSCEREKARTLLAEAERVALELGMNTREYAARYGRGIPILEESWRRTWWDLFVVDGMVAGVHRLTNFLLFDVHADAALPCEEHQYLSGNIPPPMSLADLEDQDFSGDDREFSSFAYRVLAGRNLGKFMRVPPIFGPEDENLARIEALLTNWRLHLPTSKKDALNQKLQSDEMIFQANMMTHATSIMLHQPHSQLDSSPTRSVTSCAPHRPVPSGDLFNAHTNHTITSAAEISKMITHRVPLLSHTHFFTCVVTLSSLVHLSKWALFFIPHDDDELRQQIRLNIGALNKLSSVWKAAGNASGQVKGVAQEIYRTKKASQIEASYWQGFTQEEVMNSIAVDETIMHDIETGLGAIPLPDLDALEP
ncbi:C6 zinc finger domain-containing protein [Colletotrichum plurivorum]|uniref:C6 zinc finger domain-containing protein n=1 Tax=Colletotrichum plurivorum TaxID=2175906 RepID=A0A8H6JWI1_9PEZI|nr:C6 zinc finger domain-containing protein [Colletotrichum plurivorum]